MFTALISFLGGNAFRLLFGELFAYLSKRQDHQQELERLQLQEQLDAAQHARNLETLKTQADLGVKTVQVQRDADLDRLDVGAWAQAVGDVGRQTGLRLIDYWNGAIRPLLATLAIGIVVAEVWRNGWALTDWDRELIGAILGLYVADRSLARRGK